MSELQLIMDAIYKVVNPALDEMIEEIYEELGALGYRGIVDRKIPYGVQNALTEYARSITIYRYSDQLCTVSIYCPGTNILMCDRMPSVGEIDRFDPNTITKEKVKEVVKKKIGVINPYE